jgi:predicted molibdopterin-dependent oxidoreductase YjgC
MKELRINKGLARGRPFEIEVDGRKITAYEGETIAAALIAAGLLTFNRSHKRNEPCSLYCGIGVCHQCVMIIDGTPNTRACQTMAFPGCKVETQIGPGKLEQTI